MFNLLSKFISWLKKIFSVRPEIKTGSPEETVTPTEKSGEVPPVEEKPVKITLPEEKPVGPAQLPEEKQLEIPSDKKTVEIKPPEEKITEIPPEKGTPSDHQQKTLKEEVQTAELPQELEKVTTKAPKPYIKKAPLEGEDKEQKKPSEDKNKLAKQKKEIDLGKIKSKKPRSAKQTQQPAEVITESIDKTSEGKEETPTRIESPFVEFALDEAKVFLVVPEQKFKSNIVNNIPQQLQYKLRPNEKDQSISVKVSEDEQGIKIEEKRIELEKPLMNFEVMFPDELEGRTYSYKHNNEFLYAFIAIGNNRSRMHYLYDDKGNYNPLPKKDVWVLLKEDFKLITEPDVIEERWIWENYQPSCLNLKKTNELNISRGTAEVKIPCETTFSIDGDGLVEDDFKEDSPLFAGKSIKINAPPEKNSSDRVVWVQNKQAGNRVDLTP